MRAAGGPLMFALREGYTTGACAAAAAKAAMMIMCGWPTPESVEFPLPDGSRVSLPVLFAGRAGGGATAAVRKFAGDDPDDTDGIRVEAHVSFIDRPGVQFLAGEGVGIVTKPGLSVPPGEPAINPVPRRMIEAALAEVCNRGVKVRISVPGGREIARKTFNPKLGIVGGISILGTSGKVRPFSVSALVESLKCSLSLAAACGVRYPVLTPGNIGERAARKHFILSQEQVVQVANHWGVMLDEVLRYDFSQLLIMGHPGKLAKLAEGNWDTHSAHSRSAVSMVRRIAEESCGEDIPDSGTVEGVFSSLRSEDRLSTAAELSLRISRRIGERLSRRHTPAVVLINMSGELIGSCGDLSPWVWKRE